MPVGQLDGGHIAYGLFGQRRLFVWPGLLTWAVLIALTAEFTHRPALDDVTPPHASALCSGPLPWHCWC